MADNSRKGEIEKLLNLVIENGATDLHISSGKPPMIRQDGSLKSLEGWETLDKEGAKDVALSLLSDDQEKKFWENKDVDFSFAFEDKARFRVSVYQETGNVAAALRFIPNKVRTIEELNLPPLLHNFSQASQGFFLVVGHGKSAALAAIIDDINKTRQDHILTIEDPIEYQFEQEKCIIDQREVGVDCLNFQSGLRAMFREDVDICMIGEMRDPETIATAMTAAETGHLILSTLHTNTASQTIDRIIDSFPPHQQAQVRSQMASTLLGVISRRLVPCKDGGVINAIELMIANSAIRNLIREGKVHQIDMVIDTSSEEGMISLNRSLADLVKRGIVDQEKAINFSPNPNEFNMLTQ